MLRLTAFIVLLIFVAWLGFRLWRGVYLVPTRRAMKQAARNPAYMSAVAERIGRRNQINAPENPSPEYIRYLIERLLDEKDEDMVFPRKQLEQIGAAAEPYLLAVLDDPRYKRASEDGAWLLDSPHKQVVELLAAIGSAPLVDHLAPLLDSSDENL